MNLKYMIPAIIGIVVVITVIATTLVPIVGDNSEQMRRTTMSSSINFAEYGEYYDDDVTMVIDSTDASTVADTTVKVNDEVINLRSGWNRHVIVDSNNLMIEINTSTSSGAMMYIHGTDINDDYISVTIALNSIATVSYDKTAGTIDVVSGDDTYSFNSDYFFAVSNNHVYGYINTASSFPNVYVSNKSIEDKTAGILMTFGASITLEDDTTLSIIVISDLSGTRILYDPDDFSGEMTAELYFDNLSLVDGTTDIYTGGTPKIKVTYGEDLSTVFTPARSFSLIEVEGHVTSTPTTQLIEVIPLLLIASVLLSVVGWMVYRKM